ncbi:hypothetical protein HU200_013170 [Digitaria exilis]|uniref:Epidermal patterning factor-like protein n=1 Tax=Digitaria exilis TaxID=1010633 RepID=A0A835FEN5_9POAL|nr:hypothetical protein HU200_013170 [Digitaria exilis]CAB3483312.1 unnamed protein product [Digitaria exilis]
MRPASATAHFSLTATTVFLLVLLVSVLHQATCLPRLHPPPTPCSSPLQGGARTTAREEEEKVRLGSSPPSCRGKCYECSPCTAVQVPTLSVGPSVPSAAAARPRTRVSDEVATLSNYKPVGWKCQCRDRLYEP